MSSSGVSSLVAPPTRSIAAGLTFEPGSRWLPEVKMKLMFNGIKRVTYVVRMRSLSHWVHGLDYSLYV